MVAAMVSLRSSCEKPSRTMCFWRICLHDVHEAQVQPGEIDKTDRILLKWRDHLVARATVSRCFRARLDGSVDPSRRIYNKQLACLFEEPHRVPKNTMGLVEEISSELLLIGASAPKIRVRPALSFGKVPRDHVLETAES